MATTRTMTIELSGTQRDDGCYQMKSPSLPGFYFIIGPDEKQSDFEGPLHEALRAFIPRYLAAKARDEQQQAAGALKITRSRSQINLTAELEFA